MQANNGNPASWFYKNWGGRGGGGGSMVHKNIQHDKGLVSLYKHRGDLLTSSIRNLQVNVTARILLSRNSG